MKILDKYNNNNNKDKYNSNDIDNSWFVMFLVNYLQKFSNIFWCYRMLLILIINIDNLFKNNNIFFKWDKNRKINKKKFCFLVSSFFINSILFPDHYDRVQWGW